MHMIARRQWNANTVFYVASLPGQDGVDWGYDTKRSRAIVLTPYWQRRFAAHCRRVGSVAVFENAC